MNRELVYEARQVRAQVREEIKEFRRGNNGNTHRLEQS